MSRPGCGAEVTTALPKLTVTDPALLAFADDVGSDGPVAVEGGRTRWDLGGPLNAEARLVRAPGGIVAYTPEEMIVQVRAGTTVAELDAELAARGQRTALPCRSDSATVGGAVVVGENHIESAGRGRLRSAVLQVRYVSAEGRPISGGGPTVKNVTGFDLPRLLTGSLGTLGLVAEVILRTNPIPPTRRWFASDDANPFQARDAVTASAVLWNGSTTWLLIEGHEADVLAQQALLATTGHFTEADGPPPFPSERWSLKPSAINAEAGTRLGPFVAELNTGLTFAANPQPDRPVSDAVRQVGNRMKDTFDPTGRLNPGRSVL